MEIYTEYEFARMNRNRSEIALDEQERVEAKISDEQLIRYIGLLTTENVAELQSA